jgi:DNA replication protein DnaC
MNARKIGLNQSKAAYIAEISERTGQRIESGEHHPNRGKANENNSKDPLGGVWEKELEPMLRKEPRLKPMTLFEYVQDTYPGKYPNVLRTIQRRVQTWKALYGPSPEVMFELRHEPGMMGISDFTELKGMTITIAGKPFEHLLYHYRLAYSGWRHAHIIQGGESFIGLSEGLQNALAACGGVPKQHRTDSLSAAYKNSGGNKALTRLYDELCDHYRLQPTRNNTGIAQHRAVQEQWSYSRFLLALCELESIQRNDLRLRRALTEAQLPSTKSFSNFDFAHCPQFNPAPLMQLAEDTAWLERAGNCLIFGPSGVGKTHLAAGLARRMVELGKRAKFFAANALVQDLQHAKLQLQLPAFLKKLDRFDLLVLDDLGYVKKSEAETSVLFELIAHRYERKSLLITANQPFSQWDSIFSDSMMTVAAVDRLVHHGVILEIKSDSYRRQAATARSQST